MMKKVLITTIAVCLLGCLAYGLCTMYVFARGVADDSKDLAEFQLKNKIKNGDIIFQTSKSVRVRQFN